jgi:hypothetical protein
MEPNKQNDESVTSVDINCYKKKFTNNLEKYSVAEQLAILLGCVCGHWNKPAQSFLHLSLDFCDSKLQEKI